MIKKSENRPLIGRVKSTYQEQIHGLRSDASTSLIQQTQLFSLDERVQDNFIDVVEIKDSSISPRYKIDQKDLDLLDLEKKKLHKLEGNANHVQKKYEPVRNQNIELKDHIQAFHHYMELQRESLSKLIQDVNSSGQDRVLIKKIGNIETLIILLKEDLYEIQQKTSQHLFNSQQEKLKIEVLTSQQQCIKNKSQLVLKAENQIIEDKLSLCQKESQNQQDEINHIKNTHKSETDSILKFQLQMKEDKDHFNSIIQSLQQEIQNLGEINDEQKNQSQDQLVQVREDYQQQQQIIQDQYQCFMKEQRLAFDIRFKDLNLDTQIIIKDAIDEKERFKIQLELDTNEIKVAQKINEEQSILLIVQTNSILVSNNSLTSIKSQVQQLQYNLNAARQAKDILNGKIDLQQDIIERFEQGQQINNLELCDLKILFQEINEQNDLLSKEQINLQYQLQQQKENYDTLMIQFKKQTLQYTQNVQMNEFNQQLSQQRNDYLVQNRREIPQQKPQILEVVMDIALLEDNQILTERSSQLLHTSFVLVEEKQEESIILNEEIFDDQGLRDEKQNKKQQQQGQNQLKRQQKIVHLKKQLKQAKTLLHQQKDKWKKVGDKIRGYYQLQQIKLLKVAETQYQEQVDSLQEQLSDLNSQFLSNQVEFKVKTEVTETQIGLLQDVNQEVEEQLNRQKEYQTMLSNQHMQDLQNIEDKTNEKIRNANFIQAMYEKQFEGYELQYASLQDLAQQLAVQSQKTEEKNLELLDQISESENRYLSLQNDTAKLSQQQQKETNIMKGNYEKTINQLNVVVTNAETEQVRQKTAFKKKLGEISNIIELLTLDNTILQGVIVKNEGKVKKYFDLQQQFALQTENTQKIHDQLLKASEVIRYFNKELDNYKTVYNIFAPIKDKPAQSQSISPQMVVEQRIHQHQLRKLKENKRIELILGKGQQSQKHIEINNDSKTNLQFLPFIAHDNLIDSSRVEKQFDVADALKQYNSTQIVSSQIQDSPEIITTRRKAQSPLIPELFKQSRLLLDNLFVMPAKKKNHSLTQRRKSQLNRSIL